MSDHSPYSGINRDSFLWQIVGYVLLGLLVSSFIFDFATWQKMLGSLAIIAAIFFGWMFCVVTVAWAGSKIKDWYNKAG